MRYKREEAFRFQFRKPLQATVKILEIDGKKVNNSAETVEIMDVSPHGLRFKTVLNLSVPARHYLLEILFTIEDRTIQIIGHPVWKKTEGSAFSYGLNGIEDDNTKKEMIQALKDYAKKAASPKQK